MATINDLPNKSILDMTKDELYLHIMNVRSSRRTPKKVRKSASKKSQPKPRTTEELVRMLTPEMRNELLAELEGG